MERIGWEFGVPSLRVLLLYSMVLEYANTWE